MQLKPITAMVLVLLLGTAIAVAGYAITANNLIPNPKATPSPTVKATVAATSTSSQPQLSQEDLNDMKLDLEAHGFTITQPLNQSGGIGTGANGSTLYKGVISQDGIKHNITIEVCKDNATADSHFSLAVSGLQKLGIVGSYNSLRQWSGVSTRNGIQVNSSVTKNIAEPPYTITTIE